MNTKQGPARHGMFRTLSEQECYGSLSTTTVGRVAFVASTGQQFLPVNFQYLDGVALFQTSPDSILAEMARSMDDVAFSVEHREKLFQTGWSVVVSGSTTRVEDSTLADQVRSVARLRPWALGDRKLVIALVPRKSPAARSPSTEAAVPPGSSLSN